MKKLFSCILGILLCTAVPFLAFAKDGENLRLKLEQEHKSFFMPIQKNPELKNVLRQSAQHLQKDFYTTLLEDGTDVLLVGEEHHDSIPLRDVNLMLEELADKGLTHIASEFLFSSEQPLLDQFAKGEISYSELRKGCFLKDRSYVAIVAKRHNIQVVGVDLPEAQENPSWAMSKEGMTMRNQKWTERILDIKRKNPHAKIILHGGSFHTQLKSNYFPTMPQLLEEKGLKVKVLEFISEYDTEWKSLLVEKDLDLVFTIPENLRQYVNADYIIYSSSKPFSKQVVAEIEKAMKNIEQQHGESYWKNDSIMNACIFDPQNSVCRTRINSGRSSK